MKWVHIVESGLEGGKPSSHKTVATAILEDGVVRIEGESSVAEELRDSGVIVGMRFFTAADGETFLAALQGGYRSAHRFATGVQEGPAVVPYQMPEAKKAA